MVSKLLESGITNCDVAPGKGSSMSPVPLHVQSSTDSIGMPNYHTGLIWRPPNGTVAGSTRLLAFFGLVKVSNIKRTLPVIMKLELLFSQATVA